MPFFYADSITFHYLDGGQGLPFVFQHGLGGDVHQAQDGCALIFCRKQDRKEKGW